MKIGILTLPLHHNYGGILQAYALQNYLKLQGHEVILIQRMMPKKSRPLKSQISSWLSKIIVEHHPRRFSNAYLKPITHPIHSDADLKNTVKEYSLNAVIVGSDQVWRLEYSDEIALNFFLDFVNVPFVKKISYAASFGLDNWVHPVDITVKIAELLKRMDSISVREDSGVQICKNVFGVDAVQMIDPTLLIKKTEYLNLIDVGTNNNSEKNLIVYIIDDSKDKKDIVEKVAIRKSLNPKSINAKMKFSQKNLINIWKCVYPSVNSWLEGFNKADFVVTDSFHGVAFSLIFNKPFIAIGNKNRGLARFQSILKIFNLSNRLVFSSSELTNEIIDEEIDFDLVNKTIDEKREESLKFINDSLRSHSKSI